MIPHQENGSGKPLADAGREATVLLVSEEDYIRELIAAVLAIEGFGVLEADDARSAADHASNGGGIDLVLLDAPMLRRAGVSDMVRGVREANPKSRVLYMTSSRAYEDLFGLTDSECIHKPFTPKYLVDRLRSMLPERPDARPEAKPADQREAEPKCPHAFDEQVDGYFKCRICGIRELTDEPDAEPSSSPAPASFLEIHGEADKAREINRKLSAKVEALGAPVEDGKRKAGPEWTCVGCGNADPAKYRTIEHVIIGEPTDYDIECDECGSREFEESMENALLRVIEQRDDAAGKAASLESMRKALAEMVADFWGDATEGFKTSFREDRPDHAIIRAEAALAEAGGAA